MARTAEALLFVGDIQGCAAEFEALLEKSGFSAQSRRLIPLGDVFNRGPAAPRVLELLLQTQAQPIAGNHELWLLSLERARAEGRPLPPVAQAPHSAYAQLQQAGHWRQACALMAGWPLVRQGADWLAVHAGLHPRLPPERTPAAFLTGVRHCDAQGRLPDSGAKGRLRAPRGYRAWFYHYRGRQTVLFGHWAQRGLLIRPRLRGLDTGCVYGNALTALLWPEDRLVQVAARKAYYPLGG